MRLIGAAMRAFLLIALLLLSGSAQAQNEGQSAPALVVEQLNKSTFDLAKQHGKVVIVNFWATWCAPCRQEMPALDAIYRRYRNKGLTLIGLSADREKHRDDVVGVMHAFTFPAAMLADAKTNDFGWPSELPETYVIDREGTVRAKFTPDKTPITEQSLDQALAPLLAK